MSPHRNSTDGVTRAKDCPLWDLPAAPHNASFYGIQHLTERAAMALKITKAQVWAGSVADRPGGFAEMLEPLGQAGANLEVVLARRASDRPGESGVFLTPLKGKKAQNAEQMAGMNLAESVPTLRLEGANKAGG